MRRSRRHFVRPISAALRNFMMELLRRGPKSQWIPADIVQRDQPVIAIKTGVFNSLGHQSAGVLLELHRKMDDRALIKLRVSVALAGQEYFPDKVIDRSFSRTALFFGAVYRFIDVSTVAFRHCLSSHVSPINREACN